MIDDGNRLSFSITNSGFSITDNLSGAAIMYTQGTFTAFSLDKDIVLIHLKNIQEALMTYTCRYTLLSKVPDMGSEKSLVIREDNHFTWSLGYLGYGAKLEDNVIICKRGFDKGKALSLINKTYATLLTKDEVLTPKLDIVRRITDAGLIVWYYNKQTVVCFESNQNGNVMLNCLINKIYFPIVFVSISSRINKATLFNSKMEEIIEFPLDKSILNFYKTDEEAFDE